MKIENLNRAASIAEAIRALESQIRNAERFEEQQFLHGTPLLAGERPPESPEFKAWRQSVIDGYRRQIEQLRASAAHL